MGSEHSHRVYVADDAVARPPSSVYPSSSDHSALTLLRRLSSRVDILYTSGVLVGWLVVCVVVGETQQIIMIEAIITSPVVQEQNTDSG